MTPRDRLTTLGLLWAAWEHQGRQLTADQWQRPTRLGDWTVRMLYAHAASWPVGFAHLVGQVRQVAPTHTSAAELLGEFNRPGAVSIGILEATVHLLGLQRALELPPDVPGAGLEHTVGCWPR